MVKPSLKSKALSVVVAGTLAFGLCPAAAFAAPTAQAGNATLEQLANSYSYNVQVAVDGTINAVAGNTVMITGAEAAVVKADCKVTAQDTLTPNAPVDGFSFEVDNETAFVTVPSNAVPGKYEVTIATGKTITLNVLKESQTPISMGKVVLGQHTNAEGLTVTAIKNAVSVTLDENTVWTSSDDKVATGSTSKIMPAANGKGGTATLIASVDDTTNFTRTSFKYDVTVYCASAAVKNAVIAKGGTINLGAKSNPTAALTYTYGTAGDKSSKYVVVNNGVATGLKVTEEDTPVIVNVNAVVGGNVVDTVTIGTPAVEADEDAEPPVEAAPASGGITVVADQGPSYTYLNQNLRVNNTATVKIPASAVVTSSDDAIATVVTAAAEEDADSTTATITAIKPGVATMYVVDGTYPNQEVSTFTVTVGDISLAWANGEGVYPVNETVDLTKAVAVQGGETVSSLAGFTLDPNDKSEVVKIDADGKTLYTLNPGTTTLLAEIDGETVKLTVTVKAMAITGADNVAVGGKTNLATEYVPTNFVVAWSSSDPSVATVDDKGVVTGVKAGSVTITATATKDGMNDLVATKTITVGGGTIKAADVAKIAPVAWTGKAKKPAVKVTVDGKTLEAGKDYKVTYAKNTNVGIATATIEGIGAYTGKVTKKFKVSPAKVGFKITGAKKAVKVTLNTKSAKYNKKNMDGYQVRVFKAGDSKRMDTTVKGFDKKTTTIKGLKAATKYKVYLRTIKTVDGVTFHSQWSDKGYYATTK